MSTLSWRLADFLGLHCEPSPERAQHASPGCPPRVKTIDHNNSPVGASHGAHRKNRSRSYSKPRKMRLGWADPDWTKSDGDLENGRFNWPFGRDPPIITWNVQFRGVHDWHHQEGLHKFGIAGNLTGGYKEGVSAISGWSIFVVRHSLKADEHTRE